MSFRTRLLLACLPLALVPLAFFGLDTRRDVTQRLERQHAERVAMLADVIEEELFRESAEISARLDRLAETMDGDPRLRLALLDPNGDEAGRAYLLDYASRMMPLVGLDVLRIQTATGRILSSGHFRNEYDAVAPALPASLNRSGAGPILAEVATPSGSILALARQGTLRLGGEAFILVGGVAVDERFLDRLARGTGLDVALLTGMAAPGAEVAARGLEREVMVPLAGAGPDETARFVVRASDAPVVEARRELDRRLLAASAGAAVLALLLAAFVSGQLSRPLAGLARRAGRMDLERLDVAFPTNRDDELGELSRVLDRLTRRLRTGAARLREAERRAATADLARQVHHDVRNGLIPIRNVLHHLTQLARESPDRLPEVFLERRRTLESSVAHLHALATSYARLTPSLERRPCDLNRIARQAVDDALAAAGTDRAPLRIEVAVDDGIPPVHGDPSALRRILDNLVLNGLESLGEEGGRVLVETRRIGSPDPARIELCVTDTGRGMTPEECARIFDDFYTTKRGGTGLGLSIVRRLVGDLGGRLDVESAPGRGTRFRVELPAAPAPSRARPTAGETPGPTVEALP